MSVIRRNLAEVVQEVSRLYPVATVTGPRQSGKTTLCRDVFRECEYATLEPLDAREFAERDPRGFLKQFSRGVIIDEVQHVPGLLSYIQEAVDLRDEPGQFVLTGSQHLGISEAVAQTLAGRTAVLFLLPLSMDELLRFPDPPQAQFETVWQGGYPRIHDVGIPAERWLADYAATYLERDVRQVLSVGDLTAFATFTRLAAGRTGQLLNLSSLGADAGVSHNTAKSWFSVLEATFVCHRMPAWTRNVRKQQMKSPKIHFVDAGLACHLLGIRSEEQLATHPLRGAVFESWVAGEVLKSRVHAGKPADIKHYRESRGIEVDLVLDASDHLVLVEVKSGSTVASDWFRALGAIRRDLVSRGETRRIESRLVYGGDQALEREGVNIIPWNQIHRHDW